MAIVYQIRSGQIRSDQVRSRCQQILIVCFVDSEAVVDPIAKTPRNHLIGQFPQVKRPTSPAPEHHAPPNNDSPKISTPKGH